MNPNTPGEQPQATPPAVPQPPSVGRPAPVVDPAALQAALNEPQPQQPQVQPQPQPAAAPAPQAGMPQDPNAELEDEELEYDDESDEPVVTWQAHEYLHQEKGSKWFVAFGVVVAVLVAVSIFVMNSWSFAILLVVIAVVVVVYSRRPPRELTYSLAESGLIVDGKLHRFENFKSFGVIRDGAEFSVMLIPTQRFQPGVTVYFPEEHGEAIVDMLGSRLPMKDLKLDVVDKIVRLLRL